MLEIAPEEGHLLSESGKLERKEIPKGKNSKTEAWG